MKKHAKSGGGSASNPFGQFTGSYRSFVNLVNEKIPDFISESLSPFVPVGQIMEIKVLTEAQMREKVLVEEVMEEGEICRSLYVEMSFR